jgi:hypothetical protein
MKESYQRRSAMDVNEPKPEEDLIPVFLEDMLRALTSRPDRTIDFICDLTHLSVMKSLKKHATYEADLKDLADEIFMHVMEWMDEKERNTAQ